MPLRPSQESTSGGQWASGSLFPTQQPPAPSIRRVSLGLAKPSGEGGSALERRYSRAVQGVPLCEPQRYMASRRSASFNRSGDSVALAQPPLQQQHGPPGGSPPCLEEEFEGDLVVGSGARAAQQQPQPLQQQHVPPAAGPRRASQLELPSPFLLMQEALDAGLPGAGAALGSAGPPPNVMVAIGPMVPELAERESPNSQGRHSAGRRELSAHSRTSPARLGFSSSVQAQPAQQHDAIHRMSTGRRRQSGVARAATLLHVRCLECVQLLTRNLRGVRNEDWGYDVEQSKPLMQVGAGAGGRLLGAPWVWFATTAVAQSLWALVQVRA